MTVEKLINLLKDFEPTAEVKILSTDENMVEHIDKMTMVECTRSTEEFKDEIYTEYFVTLS